jgi:hypothetical protein
LKIYRTFLGIIVNVVGFGGVIIICIAMRTGIFQFNVDDIATLAATI